MVQFAKRFWKCVANLPQSMRQRYTKMLTLWGVIPISDAIKVVLRSTRNRAELRLRLNALNRQIVVRANTSDLSCLEKVFIEQEYRLPTEINPEFAIQPQLIVDAGANIGMATLYFAHIYPEAHIFAIEPESSNFDLLSQNCEGIPNLRLCKAALWPHSAKLKLCDASAGKWAFTVRPSDASEGIDAITIPQILDTMGMKQIDLLKLDIEGAERELFSAGSEQWLPRVRMIVIELHDRFKSGCSQALYSKLVLQGFDQEIRGENIFILMRQNP